MCDNGCSCQVQNVLLLKYQADSTNGYSLSFCISFAFYWVVIHHREFLFHRFTMLNLLIWTKWVPPLLLPGTRCISRISAGLTSMLTLCLRIIQKFSLRFFFRCSCQTSILMLHFCEYCRLKFAIEVTCRASLATVASSSLSFCTCTLLSPYSGHQFFLRCQY